MKKKDSILAFVSGLLSGIFVVPLLLGALGIPGFEVVLTALFGERNPWAIVFSVLLIVLFLFVTNRLSKKGEQKNV
ncbi:hypothetical protein [Planomicrobium okeanokoites]|uniref:hypothetical protein n=1 Tax=Planomicrobium okeanokoites TaxID=244 RepID=UPI0024907C04|nr:hypothetical protein [Planomicrobium okeanokoites]